MSLTSALRRLTLTSSTNPLLLKSTSPIPSHRLLNPRLNHPPTPPCRRRLSRSTPRSMTSPKSQPHSARQHRGEETTGISSWKQRPPYLVHDENADFDVKYEANCHCGKVRFQLSRKVPLDSKLCHCTTCQTQHAAPFQWAAIFHKTDINFTNGHHDLEWYDPSEKSIEHKLPCKVRCSYCHSPIMDEGRNMILLFPSLIHLKTDEEKALFKPRCHMFYGQRVMDVPDGLPKWSGLSDDSELIEDSPPEKVRAVERKREEEREKVKKEEEEEGEGKGKKEGKKGE